MMDYEPAYSRLTLARLSQRNAALIVDFIACAFLGQLIEALLGLSNSGLGLGIFGVAWAIDRVFIAGKNQGQSLGRWLMSIRVVDAYYGKSAGVLELLKRESFIYLGMAFVLAAFNSGGLTNAISLFAVIPIVIDGVIALADSEKVQTVHDKIGGTIVIACRKGLQMDRKITKLFGQASRTASKAYQSSRSARYAQGYDRSYNDDFEEFDDRDRGGYSQAYDDGYGADPYQESNPRQNANQRYTQSSSRSRRPYEDDSNIRNARESDRYTGIYEDSFEDDDDFSSQRPEPRLESSHPPRRSSKKKKSRKPRY
jgi:uncharacterized RDD family membrane protein YckC